MGKQNYKVSELIKVVYQASGATTGLTDVTMEIYDETGSKDIVNFPDVTLTEIGSTGRYEGSFTPDVVGNWEIMINSVTKPGKMVRQYEVGDFNVNSIGGIVGSMEADIRGVDNDTLKTLSDQIDTISVSPDQPPILG